MRLVKGVAYVIGLFTALAPAGVLGQTLTDALDNGALVWTTCPSNALTRPWKVEVNPIAHDGVDDAVSGNQFQHGTTSWLETTLVGPGTLSFWCRVSSEDVCLRRHGD